MRRGLGTIDTSALTSGVTVSSPLTIKPVVTTQVQTVKPSFWDSLSKIGTSLANTTASVANSVSVFKNGGSLTPYTSGPSGGNAPEPKSNLTKILVIGGVSAAAIIGGVILLRKTSKK
jgi:hypothetical protein